MNHYNQICEQAADNYGLITVATAQQLGVHRKELLLWEKIGRLERCGRGVYRLSHYAPTEYDRYAEAVALVGGDAAIYGESVLAMHNLALVNPSQITVVDSRRVRRTLPKWIRIEKKPANLVESDFNGIACQSLPDAFRTCRKSVMPDRLSEAVREAERRGLLGVGEADALKKEFPPAGAVSHLS